MKETTNNQNNLKETKIPFFARKREGKALVIKTTIKAGAGALEQLKKQFNDKPTIILTVNDQLINNLSSNNSS